MNIVYLPDYYLGNHVGACLPEFKSSIERETSWNVWRERKNLKSKQSEVGQLGKGKNNNVENTIQGIYLNQTILCLPIMSSHPRNVDSPIITVHSFTKPSCQQSQLIIRGNLSHLSQDIENCLDMSILVNTTRDTNTITHNRHDMRVSPLLCVY